ncbi:COX15/CtaA family protein [Salinifilum aidingensis]
MPTVPARISNSAPAAARALSLLVVISQTLISITGATVRVTESGLGCPTWPQCFPGSLVPQPHPEVAALHQAIEFGNRMLAPAVGIIALLCCIAAWLVRPKRRRLRAYALVMPLGVVVQAVIGGMTVWVDLLWWSVSIHFMLSAVLIYVATQLFKAAREGDGPPTWLVPARSRRLLVALVVVTFGLAFAGTLVTAAGPHAGDVATPRLDLPVPRLAETHAILAMAYVLILAVFGVWLRGTRPTKGLLRVYGGAAVVVLAQGALGSVQYYLGVPELLVVLHVLGATLVIISTGLLWSEARHRGAVPAPAPGSTAAAAAAVSRG